jgi:hypothetical protein
MAVSHVEFLRATYATRCDKWARVSFFDVCALRRHSRKSQNCAENSALFSFACDICAQREARAAFLDRYQTAASRER